MDLFLYAQDDFFYYLKIADQILAGHGISFDGLHATNGFHPLWLVVVLALRAMRAAARRFPAVVQRLSCPAYACDILGGVARRLR